MTSKLKMEWDPKFSVDIEEIDIFQQNLFGMFNQLLELKEKKKDTKECINLINEINEYSKIYFSTEERLLRKNKYPDFGTHAKAHRQFTKISVGLRREIAENMEKLTTESILELRNWLTNHILELDSLYIPFIRIINFIENPKQKN